MKKYFLIFLTAYLFQLSLLSQQASEYNLYHYNLSLVNPAATAYQSCKKFNITDRHQWSGIEGAPAIQSVGVQLPKTLSKYRSRGLGMNLVRDVNGATQNLGIQMQYAYHLTLRTLVPIHLSLGLAGKFGQYSFDESGFNAYQYDPIVSYGKQTEWYYNFATGFFLYSDKYYIGVGVYNLFPKQTTLYDGYGNNSYFTTIVAGYSFQQPRRNSLRIDPSIYIALGKNFYQVDLTNKLYFENGVWTGACFRKYIGDYLSSGQNVLLFFGYEFDRWNISYTYDLGINQLQKNHYGSHQLSLTYTICRQKYACPAY